MVAQQQQNREHPNDGYQRQPSRHAARFSASRLLTVTLVMRPWEGWQLAAVVRTPGGRQISHARQVTPTAPPGETPCGGILGVVTAWTRIPRWGDSGCRR